MKKALTAKSWLISFLALLLATLLILGSAAYIIDPFYRFRYSDNSYFNNTARFPGPGLVRNYEYDTLILGSSMTQNFNMDQFRRELNADPLHIGIGGMGLDELLAYIQLAETVGKCSNYYICIDQYMLTRVDTFKTPDYLFQDHALAKLRYLLSYEVWFRYLPLDTALAALQVFQVPLPSKLQQSTSIDYLGNWEGDFPYGEETVIQNYLQDSYRVSAIEPDGLYTQMTKSIDRLFAGLEGDPSRYHLFFPPYSALFWSNAQHEGYFDIYQDAKRYFLQQAEYYGVKVYDFQSADFISDLDLYRDMTHYGSMINVWMTECFAEDSYLLTEDNIEANIAKLRQIADTFSSTHNWLFTSTPTEN